MAAKSRVLIIGAGITGLLLAQTLKSHNIDFEIYERDADPDSRGQGWGLAIHWALASLRSLLPDDLRERLPETYVDPALQEGSGKFPLFRLDKGERLYENVSEKRVRVSRERLRALLMSNLEVKWSKTLVSVTQKDNHSVRAGFADGSFDCGTFLAGCDGTRSKVREILCSHAQNKAVGPDQWRNYTLPVRFLGASAVLSSQMAEQLRNLDNLFFQGSHPNGSFMFFGIQDTPTNNQRPERHTYRCQINISWPYRAGFLGQSFPTEVPVSQHERLKLARKIAATWASPFRDAVYSIPEDHVLQSISIEDYMPTPAAWGNIGGKATLVGDAAHAMTMYRGEAANHNIEDVKSLINSILQVNFDFKEACSLYEKEMTQRTAVAVLASRQACLDAHEHEKINDRSPLISKRSIIPGGA